MKSIKKTEGAFYIGNNIDNATAIITFIPAGDSTISINHTYVSNSLRGQGIAKVLLDRVVEYAREEKLKIIPDCSYAQNVMVGEKETGYEDVLIVENRDLVIRKMDNIGIKNILNNNKN